MTILIKIEDRIIIVSKMFSDFLTINAEKNGLKSDHDFVLNENIYLYNNDNIFEFKITKFWRENQAGEFYIYYDIVYLVIEGVHIEGFQYHKDIFTEQDFNYVKNLKTIKRFNL